MSVFIEVVLIDNLIIDYLLLRTTFLIMGKKYKNRWLIFSSIIGAIFALLYPLLRVKGGLLFLIKILSGALMVLISNSFIKFKEYYYNFLVFLCLTFLSGGALSFLSTSLENQNITKYTSLFIIIPFFLVIEGVRRIITIIYKRKTVVSNLYEIKLSDYGLSINEKGFYDTGNLAYHNGLPVIFADRSLFEKALANIEFIKKLKKITVSTVQGKEQKNCFYSIISVKKDKTYIRKEVYVCIANISDLSGYRIILHPDLIEEEYERTIKKAN